MTTLADIVPYIPRAFIAEALDDVGQGTGEVNAQLLESIAQAAARRAAGCFGGSAPAAHAAETADAEIIFTCETIYDRRGYSDRQNPFAAKARDWEKRLRALAGGLEGTGGGEAGVIAEPCRASARGGLNLV